MGKILLVMLPNLILVISIIIQGGTLTGQTNPVCLTNSSNCSTSGSSITVSCPYKVPGNPLSGGFACQVSGNCQPVLPAPAYCAFGAQYINPGDTITIQAAQQAGTGIFNFGTIGSDGFIVMISVAVGVAVLSGVTIFGTGINGVSIRILFTCGLLLGIFGFLALLEGFASGNVNSFFNQLNANITLAGVSLGIGTIAFVGLTIMETAGIITYVAPAGDD